MRKPALAAILCMACSACADRVNSDLPTGQTAYDAMAVTPELEAQQLLLREGDKLSIKVFGEPELSWDNYVVDLSGKIQVPLAGEMVVAGKTTGQLRTELTSILGGRYLRDPQVSINVLDREAYSISIEGQVNNPGVFATNRPLTLLSAIALGKSTTKVAKLDEIIVFRVIDGKRAGARFDLREIRAGKAPDPIILPGDTIVVGFSSLKGAFREFLAAAPLLYLFRTF